MADDALYKEVGDYLLQTQSWHDCHFLVGEDKEKIGAVRCTLINQSRSWWSMLASESPLVESGDIALPDIEPDIFRLLLKHSYGGLENCSSLSDDTMIKLCYCANKYLMSSLMTKIAARLQPTTVDQLFPALHCLTYYNLTGVEEAVTQLVQTKTSEILAHPEFLECDVDSVTFITKQGSLNCEELELWKAVVTWARHRAHSEEGPKLREWILHPLKHIRVLVFSLPELCQVLFSTEILNFKEIAHICQKDVSSVKTICGNKETRNKTSDLTFDEFVVDIIQNIGDRNNHFREAPLSYSSITVKTRNIMLQSITCRGMFFGCTNACIDRKEYIFGKKDNVCITITIECVSNKTVSEKPVSIKLVDFEFSYCNVMIIPTVVGGKGVILKANSKYNIKLSFGASRAHECNHFSCWSQPDCANGHVFTHGTFHCSQVYENGVGTTPCHIIQFKYSV